GAVRHHTNGRTQDARRRLRHRGRRRRGSATGPRLGHGVTKEAATMRTLTFGNRTIGEQQPVYVVAEIGINHNGSVETAKRLIDAAVLAGCSAVKFQKRTPELCVPEAQRDRMRETPWGTMSYLEYRRRVEFGMVEYGVLIQYCKERSIDWFASCWDEPSVD